MVDVKELQEIANAIESDYEMDVEAKRIRATANELESLRKQIAEKDAIVERLQALGDRFQKERKQLRGRWLETRLTILGEIIDEIESTRQVVFPTRAAAEASAAGGTVDAK